MEVFYFTIEKHTKLKDLCRQTTGKIKEEQTKFTKHDNQ